MSNSAPELKKTFDILMILENIKLISETIKQMEEKGINNSFDFELKIMEDYPEFYQSHPFLVKKVCSKSDLTMLYKMLNNLQEVENGNKSLASVEMSLGNDLANQFLYPVINKKK